MDYKPKPIVLTENYRPLMNLRPEKQAELKGWEKELALFSVSDKGNELSKKAALFAGSPLLGKLFDSGGLYASVATATQLVPFGRFMLPSSREEFDQLSDDQKSTALMWDAVGLGLSVLGTAGSVVKHGAGGIFKAASKGFSFSDELVTAGKGLQTTLPRVVKPLLKTPVEDTFAPSWKPFDLDSALTQRLKTRTKLDYSEQLMVKLAAEGDSRAMHGHLAELWTAAPGKGAPLLPGRWKGLAEFKPGKGFRLTDEWTEKLSPEKLRRNWAEKTLKDTVRTELPGKRSDERIFGAIQIAMKERYGWDFAMYTKLEDLPETSLSWLADDLLKSPKMVRAIDHLVPFMKLPSYILPKRVVFGWNELVWGAMTKVYKPVNQGVTLSRVYNVEKISRFNEMLHEAGLVTELKEANGLKKAVGHLYKDADVKLARQHVDFADNLIHEAKGAEAEQLAEARAAIEEAHAKLAKENPRAAALTDTFYRYMDHLYKDQAMWSLSDAPGALPSKLRLSELGKQNFQKLFTKHFEKIDQAFSTKNQWTYSQKVRFLDEMLGEFKASMRDETFFDLAKFKGANKTEQMKLALAELDKAFTVGTGKKGKWLPYLESYAPRLEAERQFMGGIFRKLNPSEPFYQKERAAVSMLEDRGDLESLLQARTRSQAKEMFLRHELEGVAEAAKNMPEQLRDYTTHFIAQAMGLPTATDAKVASFIEALPFTKNWDAARVVRVGNFVNDLTYLGALGFKPFSALRNLFQPLTTVPTDLGGAKDIVFLAKGYARALDPKFRALCQDIGIIAEYAPEAAPIRNFLDTGVMLGNTGISLPKMETIREAGMLLFRSSDYMSRYATAGAAASKWEWALQKVGGELTSVNLPSFIEKSGISIRYPWVADEITGLLRAGRTEDALHAFMKDVVADTQFLYGAIDAPSAATKFGALGRTGTIFQSWWMNYLTGLTKAGTLGTSGQKLDKAFGFIMSSAMAYMLMEPLFGSRTAAQTVALGPLPSQLQMPPAWAPVYHTLLSIRYAAEEIPFGDDLNLTRRHMSQALRSSTVMIPGGLQMQRMVLGAERGGPGGLIKATLGLGIPRKGEEED